MKRSLFVLALIVLVVPAVAQVKDLALVDTRSGPPNFSAVGGTNCSSPFVLIPDGDPDTGVSDILTIADTTTITNLSVVVQATHTWVGDLDFRLTHDDTGTSALIIDRPGYVDAGFGCSGTDYDTTLNDANPDSVEDACEGDAPSITGDLAPAPDALAVFNGESIGGSWTMLVHDNAGADSGTLDTWCVDETVAGGDGGTGTPATSTWGVIALIALFMSVSLFYLRRRSGASA